MAVKMIPQEESPLAGDSSSGEFESESGSEVQSAEVKMTESQPPVSESESESESEPVALSQPDEKKPVGSESDSEFESESESSESKPVALSQPTGNKPVGSESDSESEFESESEQSESGPVALSQPTERKPVESESEFESESEPVASSQPAEKKPVVSESESESESETPESEPIAASQPAEEKLELESESESDSESELEPVAASQPAEKKPESEAEPGSSEEVPMRAGVKRKGATESSLGMMKRQKMMESPARTGKSAALKNTPVQEDCWSEEATATLIEAWGRRYMELKRGIVRKKDWLEVVDAVNAVHGHRTEAQCKNRIDAVKKRYKLEKGKPSSSWTFFRVMDSLIPPQSVTSATPVSESMKTTKKFDYAEFRTLFRRVDDSLNSLRAPVVKESVARLLEGSKLLLPRRKAEYFEREFKKLEAEEFALKVRESELATYTLKLVSDYLKS